MLLVCPASRSAWARQLRMVWADDSPSVGERCPAWRCRIRDEWPGGRIEETNSAESLPPPPDLSGERPGGRLEGGGSGSVQYSGRLRPMADETQRFIATWAEALSLPQAPATFHREVLVLEDGIEYWLPVQDVVADAMILELEPGQAIEIFAVYAGQSLHDHVFLVNEILTAGKPPAEGRRRFRRISLGELG
jgi:hypothetical protein